MSRHLTSRHLSQLVRHGAAVAALAAAVIILPLQPAAARGPENIADVAEQVIDAVVNISTSQKVDARVSGMPDLPPGSPMEEFFDEFALLKVQRYHAERLVRVLAHVIEHSIGHYCGLALIPAIFENAIGDEMMFYPERRIVMICRGENDEVPLVELLI